MSEAHLRPPEFFRQSTISSAETCGRRTWHDLQLADQDLDVGYVGSTAALGRVWHAVAAEILLTLRRQQETQIAGADAMAIAFEVYAHQPEILDADDRWALVTMANNFAQYEWDWRRYTSDSIERRLSLDIACPDGVIRTYTGRPDLMIWDPPDGLVIPDYKTGRGKARIPRGWREGDVIEGPQYLNPREQGQGKGYALLAMRAFPSVARVIFRLVPVRTGDPPRQLVIGRADLDRIELEIGIQMAKLDDALKAGAEHGLWKPRPGAHCHHQCPAALSCPVPDEARGVGALATDEQADAAAARLAAINGVRAQLTDALKAKHEAGYSPAVGDGTVMRWEPLSGTGRRFGAHPPVDPPVEVDGLDLVAGLQQMADRQEAA